VGAVRGHANLTNSPASGEDFGTQDRQETVDIIALKAPIRPTFPPFVNGGHGGRQLSNPKSDVRGPRQFLNPETERLATIARVALASSGFVGAVQDNLLVGFGVVSHFGFVTFWIHISDSVAAGPCHARIGDSGLNRLAERGRDQPL
jgi:hypothetical protein